MAMTDEQAMWRVQTQDDHRAFAELADRWDEPLWRLCARVVGDAHRAEDLKQEALARLFEKRKDYRPPMKVSAWLRRIALNLCYDELRRTMRRGESALDESADGTDQPVLIALDPPPDDRAAALEEGELVRRALMQLPEMYRTVLVLRHYERLKLREIAEVLEVPEGTVNSRMAVALDLLTRALAPAFGTSGQTQPGLRTEAQPKLC